MKKEEIIIKLGEKLGEKLLSRVKIIADEKYGTKEVLKLKFFQSILDGYINPNDLWVNDDTIKEIKSKIDSSSYEDKKKIICEIVSTYDTNDPKIKSMIQKYKRYLKNYK